MEMMDDAETIMLHEIWQQQLQ